MAACADELKIIIEILLPAILNMFARQFVNRMTLAFVGTYDPIPDHIASAALGTMYANITGISIGAGMTLAVAMLTGQNYGRGMTTENGVILRQVNKVHAICFAFSLTMAVFAAEILGACHQPAQLLVPVRNYALVFALSLPGSYLSMSINMALSTQRMQKQGLFATLVSSIVNFCCSWGFLAGGMGFIGIAWATVVSSTVQAIYLIIYLRWSGMDKHVLNIPDKVTKEGRITLGKYIRLAFPSASSMWAEWWAAELLAMFAGTLPGGATDVAANGLLFNTLAIFYMAFVGISQTSTARVSFYVGAQDATGVNMCVNVLIAISVCMAVVVAIALKILGPFILHVYTHDEAIVDAGVKANMGIVLSIPPYALFMCYLGILRSCGKQFFAAKITWFAFYVVGVPFSFWYGARGAPGLYDPATPSLLGIWFGNVLSLTTAAILMTLQVVYTNWPEVITNLRRTTSVSSMGPSEPFLAAGSFENTDADDHLSITSLAVDGTPTSMSATARINP